MTHKAGFVNIIGNPNVGKSTLMNALVGKKLSIITPKAQTTRNRILGIVNGADFQIVYSDTPGMIAPAYNLHEKMMKEVNTAFTDADIILFVTEVTEEKIKTETVVVKLQNTKAAVLLLVNKIDLSDQENVENILNFWKEKLPAAVVLPLSALRKFNVDKVFELILEHLSESPPYFPKDQLTDKPERFFMAEILREKMLMYYKKEIPYSAAVIINSFKEEEKIIRIEAEIFVERESQKAIVIGNQGKAIKKLGTHARRDMENFLGKKVFLKTFVKVNKDWRKDDRALKMLGYG